MNRLAAPYKSDPTKRENGRRQKQVKERGLGGVHIQMGQVVSWRLSEKTRKMEFHRTVMGMPLGPLKRETLRDSGL